MQQSPEHQDSLIEVPEESKPLTSQAAAKEKQWFSSSSNLKFFGHTPSGGPSSGPPGTASKPTDETPSGPSETTFKPNNG